LSVALPPFESLLDFVHIKKGTAYLSFSPFGPSPVGLVVMASPRYADLYTNLPDPFAGDYTNLYTGSALGAIGALALLDVVAQALSHYVLAFLGDNHNIHVVHRLAQLQPSLLVAAGQFTGHVIGLLDEINDFGSNLVAVQDDFLETFVVPAVPAAGEIALALAADPVARQLLPPNAPLATDVTTRFATLVPPPYVPQLLRALGQGAVSPRSLWDIATDVAAHPQYSVSCLAFVNWCRVAVAGGLDANHPFHMAPGQPASIVMDAAMGHSRNAIHLLSFPQLAGVAAAAANPVVFQPIADALASIRVDNLVQTTARAAERAEAQLDKVSVATFFKSGLTRLRRICQVNTPAELPPIWHELARVGIKGFRQTLEMAVQEPPTNMDVSLAVPGRPVITAELAKDVSQFRFMQGMNDLEDCLSPFSTSYPDQASVSKANYYNSLHDQQSLGGMAPTLTEQINLKEAQARAIPMSYVELKEVCLLPTIV
jgi:hypothetical protein